MKQTFNCENKRCYVTNELLSSIESDEHIIPNSLGGFLKSNKLVLSRINTGMFDKLDSELAKKIEISNLIPFKRDRKKQPSLKVKGSDGYDYLIDSTLETTLISHKPEIVETESGEKKLKFPIHQKEEIFKSQLRKNPLLTREAFEKTITEITIEQKVKFTYLNELNLIDNSNDSFRAIAKIATNFAVLNNIKSTEFGNFIDFIKGANNFDKIQLGYFYPNELLNYELEEKEISHILYLKASKKEKLLFCYIELFNTHCFIVNLSYNYLGEDFSKCHIWDVINGEELIKNLKLNVKKEFLMSRKYVYYPEVEKDYLIRLRRIGKILNLPLVEEKSKQ